MEFKDNKKRCSWANNDILIDYHDSDYGKIKMGDNDIFAKLCLQMLAKGKYYTEVLKQKEKIMKAFLDFDIDKCAQMDDARLDKIIEKSSINKRIAYSVRNNAKCCIRIAEENGSLFKFVYRFKQPDRLFAALKKYGFRQIEESNVVWLMRNIGAVEPHEPECFMNSSQHNDGMM